MGVYFKGNAPSLGSDVFYLDTSATVYYLPGTTGWSTTFGGLLTAVWQSPPPGAWTLSASTITTTGATLNGMVNPYGSLTAAWFQWGTTTNYGNLTAATGMGSGTNALPLSASLAGLIPGVTYHFRIAATNDYGLVYGSDQSFTTWGLPQVSTLPATGVSTNSATLNAMVNPYGFLTAAWFQWGTTTDYGNLTAVTGMGSGTNALPLSASLAGLTPGVTYHYRVAATNSNGAGLQQRRHLQHVGAAGGLDFVRHRRYGHQRLAQWHGQPKRLPCHGLVPVGQHYQLWQSHRRDRHGQRNKRPASVGGTGRVNRRRHLPLPRCGDQQLRDGLRQRPELQHGDVADGIQLHDQ